ncbi:hypothetical protein EIN_030850 [Entamoeba invadens IP1]|uniref:Uncharacterized protein n=1 Tax=Entamoeba invadens IP1 TaxID=370355 RepID=A0A0A1TY54_ENTIV|nr:hypothetical protein EIN_030850 [Entamoeba invadens IP1]ELP86404.1 hypothetical protein EIN_030850 [Entamoeba invadens IP1]|eukprot:XP_004185750.1 hypothetical protein EIN_030850 [Entamoeba invadens IP1]
MNDLSMQTLTKQKCQCIICQRSDALIRQDDKMKTTKICVMVLKALQELNPTQEYFSLKEDIFKFIKAHWHILSFIKPFTSQKWRKAILDAFNHCTSIQSGKGICKSRGFYKLKSSENSKESSVEAPQYKNELISSAIILQKSLEENVRVLSNAQMNFFVCQRVDVNYHINSLMSSIFKTQKFIEFACNL